MSLFPVPAPDLASYDWLLVNTSAGKDSQAMFDVIVEQAAAAGLRDRLVAVHCDLGRVEWQGTKALAAEHAAHYGVRFEVVARDRDLLHQIEHERRKFPDNARRYCTSDQKTAQVRKLITALAAETRAAGGPAVPRVLNILGMRAQESPKRRKMDAFEHDAPASSGVRHVDRWLPIHDWTVEEVWARIRQAGTRHHYAYDLGMPRLSCCMCVLASKEAVILGAVHNPELAEEYARVEVTIGHRFRQDLSAVDIRDEAARRREAGDITTTVPDWAA